MKKIYEGWVTCFDESTGLAVIEKMKGRMLRIEIRAHDMPTSLVNELDSMPNVSINVSGKDREKVEVYPPQAAPEATRGTEAEGGVET